MTQEKPKVFFSTSGFYSSIKSNHRFCSLNLFDLGFDTFILEQYSVLQFSLKTWWPF